MVRISRSTIAFIAQAVLHAHGDRHDLASGKEHFFILERKNTFARKPVNRLDLGGMDVDADHAARRKAQESNAVKIRCQHP